MKKMILGLIAVSILISSVFCSYTISVPEARAQIPVTVTTDIPGAAKEVKDTIKDKLVSALIKAANKTYVSLLNKYLTQVATETAIYAASGFRGQKPAFLTMKKDEFWRQVASEAAGGFIENYFNALKEGTKQATQRKKSFECDVQGVSSTITVIMTTVTTIDPYGNNTSTDSVAIRLRTPTSSVNEIPIDSEQDIPESCQGGYESAKAALQAGGGEQIDYANNSVFNDMKKTSKHGMLDIGAGLNTLNVCQPSNMMVALKIGLGLPATPGSVSQPSCNWMEMKENWSQAIQESITNEKEYIKNIQNMFDIGSNDLSVAFSLSVGQTTMGEYKVSSEESEINIGRGFITNTNVGDRKIELPGGFEHKIMLAQENMSSPWLNQTQDAFINAAQVFISVLSQKLYEKGMAKLMALVAGKPAGQGGSSGATPAQLMDFYGVSTFGRAQSEALMEPLLDMNFGPGQNIDLLSNLASCPDINNPGPMNCVINNNFVQAINDGLTVGEALKKNLLNKNARFGGSMSDAGFNIESGDISWRAMKILRKYRILPVGWELAAEKLSTFGAESRRVTIGDIVGCYSPFDNYETTYNQEWCRGLVDPTWPLVAPLSYCVKSGFGNQLAYIDVMGEDQPASDSVAATLSTVNVLRAGDYCADEQSCIKESNNNRCDVYGYCLEERRIWKFPSDTCEPYFNSCQTFTDKQGQDIALLSNTLEYANCNADNSGCAAYCSNYNWASSSYGCSTSSEQNKYYLNDKVESCSETEDGCSQLVRLTNGSGVNLLFNGDFEFSQAGAVSSNGQLDNWYFSNSAVQGEIINDTNHIYSGSKSLKVVNNSGESGGLFSYDWSHPNQSSFPKNFEMRTGASYTLSAYVYTNAGPITLAIGSGYGGLDTYYWQRSTSTQTGSWEKVSVTLNNDEYFNANAIAIYSEAGGTFYVDNIMFEISNGGSRNFNKYRQVNYFYEKLLPTYLRPVCYEQRGNVLIKKDNAPWECNNYARLCLPAEVNCQMFTNQATGDNIPAKVNLQNYCPAACVGFASFWQQPTQFEDGREEQLVPSAANSCAASSVGCSEFTNLDTLSAGGESKEYFSYLRQCVKPTDPGANCGAFYMWQNTASTGLQLYSYTWQATTSGAPKLIDSNTCSTSSLESDSLDYDADCREVRNQAGEVFYVPYSKTISCSDNCHPYRLSDYNIDERITNESDCESGSTRGHWLANRAACVICKGGGVWDDNNQACIYKGEPTESQSCSASQRGCRLYSGTGAANWRLIINDNFDNSVNGWSPAATSSATLRNNGYSLLTTGNEVNRSLADIGLNPNAKYRLQFFAKSLAGTVNLTTTTIKEDQEDIASFNLPSSGLSLSSNDWGFYTIIIDKPMTITEASSGEYIRTPNLRLHFAADGPFLLDEVRLMEVNDEYYLLNNNLNVPEVCNKDYNGAPAAGFMLGCQKYSDQNNNTHYLHSFNDLCQESAVGCEAMLDTHNWTNYYYPFRPTTSSDISADLTPADEVIYAVYDQDKICSNNDKGCQRLGRELTYEGQAVYTTNFLRLDPDRYRADLINSIKCLPQDVGCQTWNSNNGLTFFKDPGNQLCELKSSTSSSNDVAWYKRPVKQCSGSQLAKFCVTDQDCAAISSTSQCIMNNQTNEACPVNNMKVGKTIGLGGNIIKQPIKQDGYNWVGLCPVTQSGCTEYLDPLSRVSSDLLGLHSTTTNKTIDLEAFTAYILQARAANSQQEITWKVGSSTNYSFWILDSNNQLVSTSGEQTLLIDTYSSNSGNPLANGYYNSVIFMTNAATKIQVIINNNANIQEVSIRKAIINYNINQDLTSEGCTDGQTEYDGNCLLLNERTYLQGQYSALLYDTDKTINDTNGVSPQSSVANTANLLIKVKPSRACAKWLECTTYNKVLLDNGDTKNICSSFGLCDSFDFYNNCNHFIDLQAVSTTNQTLGASLDTGKIRNLSGYSKVGYDNTGYNNDLYNLAMMSEQGKLIDDFDINGSFETVTGELQANENYLVYDYQPVGWSTPHGLGRVIVSPQQAVTVDRSFQGDYLPPDGNNFLRIMTTDFTNGIYGYVKTDLQRLIPVKSNTTYTLGGSYRTNSEHDAGFKVWEYTCQHPTESAPCLPSGALTNITNTMVLPSTDGKWRTQALKFTTKPDTKYILIELDAYGQDGVAYFDNIQLAPVLAIRSNSYAVPSCRLYPEGNSLSCDYGSASNPAIRKKGLLGYCLEYDPANEKNCLLWYPLDKVAADPIEEGVGYNGKFPLYYCLEATTSLRLEYRHAFWLNGHDPMECPPHYFLINLHGGCNGAYSDYACVPSIKSSSSYVLMIPEYEDWGKLIGNYCTKDKSIINNLVCMDCIGGDDGVTPNVNSLNDGWYLYDEILPYNNNVFYCVNGDNECDYDGNETECLNHGCSYDELHSICSWYNRGCSSPKGTLEMFNDNNDSDDGMGRGPRLRSKSFSEASLRFLCTASGYHYSEGNGGGGECINLSNGEEGLLGSEIYRDQFGLVVTNQTSSVPTSAPVYCTKFVEVVDNNGNNRFWAGRVKEGSAFKMPCYIPNVNGTGFTATSCVFLQSSIPFASIAYPAGLGEDPGSWDSILDEDHPGNQPLFYQETASGVHLGRIYSNNSASTSPRYLFAQSYAGYAWNFDDGKGINGHDYFGDSGRYKSTTSSISPWIPPSSSCNGPRTDTNSPTDYCYIAPQINNVKVNGVAVANGGTIDFNEPVFTIDLTFNSIIDQEQKPLTEIFINWGDGSPVYDHRGSFIDRPDSNTPHRFVHNYTCQETENHDCRPNTIQIIIVDHWGKEGTYTIKIQPKLPPHGTDIIQ